MLATFDGPARAVRCGLALVEHASAAGLHVSVGLHTAEVARRGADVSGDGVASTQAVADRAATRRGLGDLDLARPHRGIRLHVRAT